MTGGKIACFCLLLAALCPRVSSEVKLAWEPSNLTATAIDGDNGYNSLEITWSTGECAVLDKSVVSLIAGDLVRNQTVKTSAGSVAFTECEYWTQYEIVLQAGLTCLYEELRILKQTGPGQPHTPKAVSMDVYDTWLDFSIVEAEMPREIHGYVMQLCQRILRGGHECQPQVFIKHTATNGLQNATVTGLRPSSNYSFRLTPVIIDGSKTYNGDTLRESFRTKDAAFPKGTNVTVEFEEDNSTLTAAFGWKVSESIYRVTRIEVTVNPCQANCSKVVNESAVEFTNLNFAAITRLRIFVFFEVDGKTKQTTTAFTFMSPQHIAPITAVDVAKMSPSDVFIGWNSTMKPSGDYDVTWCRVGKCNERSVQTSEIHLTDLEASSTYTVEIVLHRGNFKAHIFRGTMQTLVRDYETAQDVNAALIANSTDGALYRVEFSIGSTPSSFEVEACDSEHNCQRNKTTNIHDALLMLRYFSAYELTVSAVYALPLHKQVRKSNSSPLSTIGTVPGPVTAIEVFNVTATFVGLQWSPPRNVPSRVNVTYEISIHSSNWTSSTQSTRIVHLTPFSEYNVSVRANASYLGASYLGAFAHILIKTDVGKPGTVSEIVVRQHAYSADVAVEWQPPAVANGPLNYYVVEYQPSASKKDSALRFHVKNNRANISLPVAQNDTLYEFRVTPVNLNLRNEEVVGKTTTSVDNVKGINLYFNVTLVNRTAHSLQVAFASSDNGAGNLKPFYIITDNSTRTSRTSANLFTVEHLRAFTNETLRIRACYTNRFCTPEVSFTLLTNVGAPSPVSNLTSVVVNRTNLALHWKAPQIRNGPLSGYIIELIDKSETISNYSFTVFSQTNWCFNTTAEYETFEAVVTAFNTNLDDPKKLVYSEPVSIHTKTSGFSAPKPENLKVVDANATMALITWEAPASDNRFIVAWYYVQVADPEREGFFTQNKSTIIDHLEPYKNFTVGVRGCTSNHSSSDCGQPRRTINTTDVSAPSAPQELRVKVLGELAAEVSWKAPLTQNGPIAGYYLKIQNSTSAIGWNFNASVLSFNVDDLQPDMSYSVSLTAHNLNRHLRRLDSVEASTKFSTVEPPRYWIAFLIITLLAVVCGGVVGVFVYRHRKAQNESGYAPLITESL